ncbi:putative 3-ketosteroid reductase [Erysiphe necator]|uniref:Putative 3-ketosteroid reductase n=1 Tax=Uncinula necator TaxID=52586 RepID=A0A0B1P8I2_UNCNE|nr:putative 3-ketosteroid reductase [Erysiphe necator]
MTTEFDGFPFVETSDDQLIVLVTGARGYLGQGISTRIIDEFLIQTKSSPQKKLILIICTRSSFQSQICVSRLYDHLQNYVKSSSFADVKRAEAEAQGSEFTWQQIMQRVLFLGVEADLCDIKSVYALADKLVNGFVESYNFPDKNENKISLKTSSLLMDVNHTSPNRTEKIFSRESCKSLHPLPRIDVILFTAGIGGWTGVRFDSLIKQFFSSPIEAMTRPRYNISRVGALLKPQSAYNAIGGSEKTTWPYSKSEENLDEPPLGEVFCSNLFGQYLLAHELMPLLSQPPTSDAQHGGKIIWVSSIATHGDSFSVDDFQGLQSTAPYESSKRLMDLLILPCEAPSVSIRAAHFFDISSTFSGRKRKNQTNFDQSNLRPVRPKNYVAHPGIFQSNILPVPFIVALICKLIFYITRWLGSPWHTINPYSAAIAPVKIALVDCKTLDEVGSSRIKWGSATDSAGNAKIRKTEVPGWGFDGKTVNEEMNTESQKGADTVSKDSIENFELLSAECWKQMEELREEWEKILKLDSPK